MKKLPFIGILLVFLAACGSAATIPVTVTETSTQIPLATASPTATLQLGETPISSPSPLSTLAPDAWKSMPFVSQGGSRRMIEVYQRGLALGRDPNRF